MKYILFIIILLISTHSYCQVYLTRNRIKFLKGEWISEQDKIWIRNIYDSTIVDTYRKRKDTPVKYFILKDTLMVISPGIEGYLKYEVIGISPKYLSIMYLENQKIFTFKKIKYHREKVSLRRSTRIG